MPVGVFGINYWIFYTRINCDICISLSILSKAKYILGLDELRFKMRVHQTGDLHTFCLFGFVARLVPKQVRWEIYTGFSTLITVDYINALKVLRVCGKDIDSYYKK